MKRRSIWIRAISLLLTLVLISPVNAYAESSTQVEARGSYYLSAYRSYCSSLGGGKVAICFEVRGTDYMDTIGVLTIEVYESINNVDWYWVRTYLHESYPGMLVEDDYMNMGYVTYYGIAGRYYKAYVCVWAGKNGGGDTRYFWTSSISTN